MQKTIGGDRLGAGKKMQVNMHGYDRSTHDMGYLWRSTMAAGTIVPFLKELALPGDTHDIDLDIDVKTHPTIGPLFGSYKIQLDIFSAPIRLYHAWLHNNKLGIGMRMADVKLPIVPLVATSVDELDVADGRVDLDNSQINPSCILSYLGIRGVGWTDTNGVGRAFNGVPYLAYWDIYKNYYANKQEEIGYVIHTPWVVSAAITTMLVNGGNVPQWPTVGQTNITLGSQVTINFVGAAPDLDQLFIRLGVSQRWVSASQVGTVVGQTGTQIIIAVGTGIGPDVAAAFDYRQPTEINQAQIQLVDFPLEDIDTMRDRILQHVGTTPFSVADQSDLNPYTYLLDDRRSMLSSQEGLGIKTYQSDLFNNWISTAWIDGPGGINEITAIDTGDGSFNIDTLIISKKIYNMLNRIAISGGSYNDWQDAVYAHNRSRMAETPMYMGGLSKELVFQEVVSNAESQDGSQPLGTLAGKGVMAKKHKGGRVTVKTDEPSYIMGNISLTPRIDYSQGNKWDVHLATMDDLHKPELDQIGFQELITEQMAFWSTTWDDANQVWVTRSAGKQPAWINYMTNVNETRGNFAIASNEMFMTLNRRYEPGEFANPIADLTTYIDPAKFNFIFAETALDSQNFWVQIAVDMTVRRKMSAKIMPNL